jgi:arylsulfatase A
MTISVWDEANSEEMMKIKNIELFFAILFIFSFGVMASDPVVQKPNIVLIMADDMGYEIPGYTGGQSYHTPNIDHLAKTGIRFTHCYSNPKCAPSRVTIMTGRYLFRTTEEWGHIPPDEITFGHVLKSAGYAVALAGKWQMALLSDDPLHVQKMGFDQFCVFGWHEGPRYYDPWIWQNGQKLKDVSHRYGPDVYVEFLIDFMSKNKNRPFFAYYPMALAHDVSNDFQPPPPPAPDGHYQSYQELVEYMDKNIGRLVNSIDSLGLRNNTLIIFTGDNGTPEKFITSIENGEYIRTPIISRFAGQSIVGQKGKLTNLGTHVPLFVNWPGHTPPGKVCTDLIDFSDFMPTVAEIGQAKLPTDRIIDGKSFADQIRGKTGRPRTWIYNQFEGKGWIRNHRWKLYKDGKLFDISSDPLEQLPVFPEEDDSVTARMRQELQKNLTALQK